MITYILKRSIGAIPLLWLVTVLTFLLLRLSPGDPTRMLMSPRTRPEDRARIAANLGLDKPLYIQYAIWLKNLVIHGDLGYSLKTQRPVTESILERVPATLILMGSAYVVSLVLALVMGVAGAVRRNTWLDHGLTFLAFLGLSIPSFWLALMAIYLFSYRLGWFPSLGMTSLGSGGWLYTLQDLGWHLVLPAGVLAVRNLGGWSRYVRASMLEVLNQDYIRTAWAKGCGPTAVVWRHALRNALLPLITLLGLSLPEILAGAFIIEYLFGWPGMGRLGMEAVFNRDYSILMGDILLGAVLVVVGNILADVAYALADPRVRLGEEAKVAS